jgi:hypothetical protein
MEWIRLDVNVLDDPKIVQAFASGGLEAVILYVWGLTYAGKHETDGWIFEAALNAVPFLRKTKKVPQALIDAGLWERTATGYQIHGWAARQPTKEQNEERRRIDRERKADWRERARTRGLSRGTKGGTPGGTPTGQDVGLTPESRSYGTLRDSTGPEDPGTDVLTSGLVGEGSGENPDAFDESEIDDRIQVKFGDVLTPDQVYNLGRLCRSNRLFLDLWPGTFEGQTLAVVTESLIRARSRDLSEVTHPRAWLEALMAEVQTELDAVSAPTSVENPPETVTESGGKRARKRRAS